MLERGGSISLKPLTKLQRHQPRLRAAVGDPWGALYPVDRTGLSRVTATAHRGAQVDTSDPLILLDREIAIAISRLCQPAPTAPYFPLRDN
jgi:hypothetical protein